MKVEYIDHMGSDLTVVNAARVSFDKTSEYVWQTFDNEAEALASVEALKDYGAELDEGYLASDNWMGTYPVRRLAIKDVGLIKYLAKHNHWTPFSHPQITLRYTVPVFVARQEFKHIVGFTRNEVSRRYVDDTPEFFIPEVWRARAENKKQGSSDTDTVYALVENDYGYVEPINSAYKLLINAAIELYEKMLASEVAPEQARMVLPQSMYTSYYVTGSLAAFARMYKLRTDPHAQKEIQDLAKMVGDIIGPLYPVSWKVLTQ